MQIIALFHYLWFIIYKQLLTNMRNNLKDRRGEILYQEHEDWIKSPYIKG